MNEDEDILEPIPSEDEDKETGVPVYRIISYPADPTLEVLYNKWTRQEIVVPKFQRGWVWKPTQASRLVESFLLGLPVPSIFVYKEKSQRQLVIDGQQRLRAIVGFFDEKLPDGTRFYLRGVSPQWEGKYYSTLSDEDQKRFSDSVLRQVVVEQVDPTDVTSIYHIFERLNTGGTSLVPQEVRNSIYHGTLNDLILELNEDATWRKVFGLSKADPRMRDAELIVRFWALLEESHPYTKPMKQFLNLFMARHQDDNDTAGYKKVFLDTVARVYEGLGPKPFHIRRGINVAAYDSVMVAVALSKTIPGDIAERYKRLLQNPSYDDATRSSTTDERTVKRRIELAKEILFK